MRGLSLDLGPMIIVLNSGDKSRRVNIYAAISQKGEVALAGYDGWPTHTNIFHDDYNVDVEDGGVGCDIINMMSLEDHTVEMMLTKKAKKTFILLVSCPNRLSSKEQNNVA